MSAPMEQMLKISYFTKIKHTKLLYILKRYASVSPNISFKNASTSESEENLSLRAQRKNATSCSENSKQVTEKNCARISQLLAQTLDPLLAECVTWGCKASLSLVEKKALELYLMKHNLRKPCRNEKSPSETKYFIENGMRKVYPYYHTFTTYVKGRWVGRTVLDVFMAECRQEKIDHAEHIRLGNVTVNGEKVAADFVLDNNMKIDYYIHRHEMPVLYEPIEIIEDTDDLLVINKPSSIPVHSCGNYGYNSVIMLLKHEHGYTNLRTLHRLDRLTSGVLIFMKTTESARRLGKLMRERNLYKEYVCRVEGEFPEEEVVCNVPLMRMSKKLSVHRVHPEGKPSLTTFTRLSYNGKSSVVKCVPHTGRTHQLRVHLQFLGYPICNDPVYNRTEFGPSKGKGGIKEKTPEQIEADMMNTPAAGTQKLGYNPKFIQKFGTKLGLETSCDVTDCVNENSSSKLPNACTSGESLKKLESAQGNSRYMVKPELEICEQNSENMPEVSDLVNKNTDINNNYGQNLNVLNAVKPCLQENSDASDFGQFESSVEKGIETYSETVEYRDKERSRETTFSPTVTDPEIDESKITIDELCHDCKYIFEDTKREDHIMYLHAVRYKYLDWEFNAGLPYWAAEDFDG